MTLYIIIIIIIQVWLPVWVNLIICQNNNNNNIKLLWADLSYSKHAWPWVAHTWFLEQHICQIILTNVTLPVRVGPPNIAYPLTVCPLSCTVSSNELHSESFTWAQCAYMKHRIHWIEYKNIQIYWLYVLYNMPMHKQQIHECTRIWDLITRNV